MNTKLFLFGLLAILLSLETMAQSSEIEIIKKNKFMPPVYKKCDIELSKEQFINLFKNDPNMTSYYNSMNVYYGIDALITASSGILIFWPVYQMIHGNDPNWNLAFIGAGCYALSIPVKTGFHKKAKEAVEYYNSGYIKKEESVHFNIEMNPNGIGLVMKF